jgi:TonB family protein
VLKLFGIALIMSALASAQDQPPSIAEVCAKIPSDPRALDSVLQPSPFIPGIATHLGGVTAGPVYKVGGGVSAPRPLRTPDPQYSKEARKRSVQGKVVLWLVIGPDGLPQNIRVAKSLGYGLDEAAIEAVRNWRFQPAKKNGKPVAVQVNVEINFRM